MQSVRGFAVIKVFNDCGEIAEMAKLHSRNIIAKFDYYGQTIRFPKPALVNRSTEKARELSYFI